MSVKCRCSLRRSWLAGSRVGYRLSLRLTIRPTIRAQLAARRSSWGQNRFGPPSYCRQRQHLLLDFLSQLHWLKRLKTFSMRERRMPRGERSFTHRSRDFSDRLSSSCPRHSRIPRTQIGHETSKNAANQRQIMIKRKEQKVVPDLHVCVSSRAIE